MTQFNIVMASNEATVVAEYTSDKKRTTEYQSEAQLENKFIQQLVGQGYTYLEIKSEQDLFSNLKVQLEKLNNYQFSDTEWDQFVKNYLANKNEGIVEKTKTIQTDYVKNLVKDDGLTKNITLIDKKNIHNNTLQVINQYETEGGTHKNRYDVTVLINGLPIIHIELKRRGIELKEAFNQINRYQRESFWADSGLFEFIQIFVISNGTHTKYYSNTTRFKRIEESTKGNKGTENKTSHSYEFTSYWADANNKQILDLEDFTKTFFVKHTLLNIITKYCVFTSEDLLLVMRPYQIAATERILNRIEISSNYKTWGKVQAGGYIWHTTGSGKTLTSFKTAQLITLNNSIEKVLFVVDRKDLDYQTMKEYDRFEKGAANSNKSTKILTKQLSDNNAKIIITTIQKLHNFISQNKTHEIYSKHVVLVFDECHRSQFGQMHQDITRIFKKYHIFGFTGTPIFAVNANSGTNPNLQTTEQAFGDKLHTYTIIDAINDGNVLKFRVDFINTIKTSKDIDDEKISAIDKEEALSDPRRISEVSAYILEHFDQKTRRNKVYSAHNTYQKGFNSIFAVSSIANAMRYYNELKKQITEKNLDYKIATIFSFSINEDEPEDFLPDEDLDTSQLNTSQREFLDKAIHDYNDYFKTNFDTSDKFQNYYKDLSLRVKQREIDILIVVNMFLTGFDATTLNTLWVDKNLKYHGLVQAYSRTNRILNSVKTYGNIVCFRNLSKATDEALALFGNREAKGLILLRTYNDYYYGYDDQDVHKEGYVDFIERLQRDFKLGELILSEDDQKAFIKLFGAILKIKNILVSFDEFEGNQILSERDFQDYQSMYIDLYRQRRPGPEKENINDDLVFEIELIKQIEVNIDYILKLIEQYVNSNCKDKEILVSIQKAIGSSLELRSKKELIEGFLERVNLQLEEKSDWTQYIEEQKEKDLSNLIISENLNEEKTLWFMSRSLTDGSMKTSGTDIDQVLPAIPRFRGNRDEIKNRIISLMYEYFEKYSGV